MNKTQKYSKIFSRHTDIGAYLILVVDGHEMGLFTDNLMAFLAVPMALRQLAGQVETLELILSHGIDRPELHTILRLDDLRHIAWPESHQWAVTAAGMEQTFERDYDAYYAWARTVTDFAHMRLTGTRIDLTADGHELLHVDCQYQDQGGRAD